MSLTAFRQAVDEGDARACEALLAAGAAANSVDECGWSIWRPLHSAAKQGSEACVSLLLKAGADVNAVDKYGNTALHKAAGKGSERCVAMLLKAGADVNAVAACDRFPTKYTPLHNAAKSGSEACVSLLLWAGADVTAASAYNGTPLHTAASSGSEACVSLLLKAGTDVTATDKYEWTPLHWAIWKGSEGCVSLLLQAGADVNAANEYGDTPVCAAIRGRCAALVALVALLAPAVTCLQGHVAPELLRVSEEDQAALEDESHWRHAAAMNWENRRVATIVVLQGESRWRRRRPLVLIRERRRAVRDAGRVHKEWEKREQQEAAAAEGTGAR